MPKTNIAALVSEAVAPAVADCGVELWDVQYIKEGPDRVLRITIDRDGGVNIDDCERVHRAVDPIIESLDPIAEQYCLEVSSPGLGRRLTKDSHFAKFIGSDVEVRLIRADENGVKTFKGRLAAVSAGSVVIAADETERAFDRSRISYVKLCDDENLF